MLLQSFIYGSCHQLPLATYPNPARATPLDSYLVLLRVGFTLPRHVTIRAVRSYRTFSPLPHCGGIFSAALSVGSHLPGITWHSAQRSPDFPLLWRTRAAIARLTQAHYSNQIGN